MNKVICTVLLLLILSGLILSQNFSVKIEKTEIYDTLGSEIIFDFSIQNISDSDLALSFVRTANILPDGWTSSLCFTFCFAPQLDTIVTNAEFGSSPISPNDSTKFSIHVFPISVDGVAEITLKIMNYDDNNEYLEYLLIANTNVTSVLKDNLKDNSFELSQNYPNPFNPTTTIKYQIPINVKRKTKDDVGIAHELSDVNLIVYDILGREVATLLNQKQKPGNYEVKFNGANYPSGVYFYRLITEGYSETKKMILNK